MTARLVPTTKLGVPMTIRPRRSVLYMPGSNARALEKAKTLPVDGVILDLEDAVAPDAKATARDQVVAAVKAGGFGERLLSRHANLHTRSWAMIETPTAIFNVREIARTATDSETRLAGFVLGTNDLAKETRAK